MESSQLQGKSQNAKRIMQSRLDMESIENQSILLRKDLARYSTDLATVSLGMIKEREKSEEINNELKETISNVRYKVEIISDRFKTQLIESLNERSKEISNKIERIEEVQLRLESFHKSLENSICVSTQYWDKALGQSKNTLQEAQKIRSMTWRMIALASVLSLILGALLSFLITALIAK